MGYIAMCRRLGSQSNLTEDQGCQQETRAPSDERRLLVISPARLQLPRASSFAVARVEPMSAEPGSYSTLSPRHRGLAALPGHRQGEANSALAWRESFSAGWLLEPARGCLAQGLPADQRALSPLLSWASAHLWVAITSSYFSIKWQFCKGKER